MLKIIAVFACLVDGIEGLLGDEGRDVLVAFLGCGRDVGLAWLSGRHCGCVCGWVERKEFAIGEAAVVAVAVAVAVAVGCRSLDVNGGLAAYYGRQEKASRLVTSRNRL